MKKEKELLVAVASQKGGVGKSVFTVLLASVLHYHKGLRVAVVDCDSPQHSIALMRERDIENVMKNDDLKVGLYRQHERIQKPAYPVIKSDPEKAVEDLRRYTVEKGEAFDVVLFDLPGTLRSEGVVYTVAAMDYIFVPLKADNIVMQSSLQFAKALEEGLAVPVRLRYTDEDNRIDTLTDDTIGNATLLLQDGKLHLLHLDFSAGQQQGVLNDALTTLLSSKQRRTFSADGALQIDADASMQLDLVAMLLTIRVSRDAFGQARQSDNRVALTPTVDTLTGVQRYNLGYSFINTPPERAPGLQFPATGEYRRAGRAPCRRGCLPLQPG